MKSASEHKHGSLMRFKLKGRSVALRPLRAEDRMPLVAFAQALPEDDLLFLQRDITQETEVDEWIKEAVAGSLITLVAWEGKAIVGYATYDRGSVRWTRHVAELRVVVAQSARGLGIGRLLLELVFERALNEGVTKVFARMTPEQTEAQALFKRLGFEQEAVLRDHAIGANELTHDLLVLSFPPRQHQQQRCDSCGVPILGTLDLDGSKLCSHCYGFRYQELGGGD